MQRFLEAIVTPSVCRRLHLQVHALQHLRVANDLQDHDDDSNNESSIDGNGVSVFVRAFALGQGESNGEISNETMPYCDSTPYLIEIPTRSLDGANAACGVDCQPDWKIELDIEGNDTAPTIALEVELWRSGGSMEQGAHPASSNARRLGSTLVFRAPMVTVEEAEPSWHALDCGGALQVTAYIEDCERKR